MLGANNEGWTMPKASPATAVSISVVNTAPHSRPGGCSADWPIIYSSFTARPGMTYFLPALLVCSVFTRNPFFHPVWGASWVGSEIWLGQIY